MLRLIDQPSLGFPCGTSSFSCMRGGGILERCHEATKLKPLYLLQIFDFFGLNVRLNNVTFSEGFWIEDLCSTQIVTVLGKKLNPYDKWSI